LAAIFDFYSWRISYRELLARKDPDESTWEEIIGSKDPTVFAVFLEDSAGLAGTFLAFLGIFLGRMLHNPLFLLPAHDRRFCREVCRGLRRAVVGMLSPGLIT
jgi:hypothetical protein